VASDLEPCLVPSDGAQERSEDHQLQTQVLASGGKASQQKNRLSLEERPQGDRQVAILLNEVGQ